MIKDVWFWLQDSKTDQTTSGGNKGILFGKDQCPRHGTLSCLSTVKDDINDFCFQIDTR